MSWSSAYVGTPYLDLGRTMAGVDCWGLACLVYDNECGIALPSYDEDYVSAEELVELSKLIKGQKTCDWQLVSEPQPFDLLLFRQGRYETHIGVCVTPRHMLHVARSDSAKVECFIDHPRWAKRFVGAYRHHALNGALK